MSLPLRGETNEVDGGYDSIHFTHCIRLVAEYVKRRNSFADNVYVTFVNS